MKNFTIVKVAVITIGVVLFGVAIGLLTGSLAFGHAKLVESNVKNGQVFSLAGAPSKIKLKFSEHLTKRSTLYVFKVEDDRIVDKGDLVIEHDTMTISLDVLKPGVYQIRWITVDEHHGAFVEGAIIFSVAP